jgi:hypothetical protein
MTEDPTSGDRFRRNVRLDPAGWTCLVRYADAYFEGKRHPATDAALLDAILKPVMFPAEPEPSFNAAVAHFAETTAQRLSLVNKTFHYGADVTKALLEATARYPKVERATADPLPFVRKLPSGSPPVPAAPWTISLPLHFSGRLPATDLRSFLDKALVAKAARLGLDALPPKVLPPPRGFPVPESVATGRHLDEALVAILAALPLTAPLPDERLVTTLRWLRSALLLRQQA